MNKLIIKKIPIANKEHQEIDFDIDKLKTEVQDAMRDYTLEFVNYTIQPDHIAILFVMRKFTRKEIGFKTGS
jgi:hypothetical protein